MSNKCNAKLRITGKMSDISSIRTNIINDKPFHIESVTSSLDKRFPIKLTNITDIVNIPDGVSYFEFECCVNWSVKDSMIEYNSNTGMNLLNLTELYSVVVEYYSEEPDIGFHEHGVVVQGFLEMFDSKPFYHLPLNFSSDITNEVDDIYSKNQSSEESSNHNSSYCDMCAFNKWITACNIYKDNDENFIDNALKECSITRDDLFKLYLMHFDKEYIDIGGFDAWKFKDFDEDYINTF